MRRADGGHPRRRAVDPPRDRGDREGLGRQEEVRLALHERAAVGEEAASVRALALSLLLCPPRWAARTSRQIRLPDRRVRPRSVGDQRCEGEGLHRQRQRHDFRRSCGRGRRGLPRLRQRTRRRRVDLSRLCLRARARPGAFLSRRKTKELFRKVFSMGKGKKWNFIHSNLFLDFLAGNQSYHCTPWGMPTRNIFGWQKPCYLLGEGYAKTFRELMETTDWDSYGTGKYEKCANCMAHCGYEPTAAEATASHPWQALKVAMFGPRTEGPMAPEIPLARQRPAEFVFSRHVEHELAAIQQAEKRAPLEAAE